MKARLIPTPWLVAGLALWVALMMAPRADAQKLRFVHPPANCRLFEKKWDGIGPFPRNGLTMPRAAWHLTRAALSVGVSEGLHVAGVSRKVSSVTALFGSGVAPHLVGAYRRSYPIDLRDWAADAVTSSAPVVLHVGSSSKRAAILSAAVFVAAYGLTSCWGSP